MKEETKHIPGYSRYTITTNGLVFDTLRKRYVKPVLSNRYPYVSMVNDDGVRKKVALHRILMLTFRPSTSGEKVEVNHLDGNTSNYSLSNLEWTSSKGNVRHAVETGLVRTLHQVSVLDRNLKTLSLYPSIKRAEEVLGDRRQWDKLTHLKISIKRSMITRPVVVRDIVTGKLTHFTSVSDCAKFFKVHRTTIDDRLHRDPNRVYDGRYQVVDKCNIDSLKPLTDLKLTRSMGSWQRFLTVKLIPCLTELEFDSLTAASEYLDVSLASIHNWAKAGASYVRASGNGAYFMIKESSSNEPWFPGPDYRTRYQETSGHKAVIVIDIENNQILEFDSTKKCAEYFDILITTLNWRLKNPTKVYDLKYKFMYKSSLL